MSKHGRSAGQFAWIPSDYWVAKVPGDVFNLRSGRLPAFDLTRCVLPEPLVLLNDELCLPKN